DKQSGAYPKSYSLMSSHTAFLSGRRIGAAAAAGLAAVATVEILLKTFLNALDHERGDLVIDAQRLRYMKPHLRVPCGGFGGHAGNVRSRMFAGGEKI